MEENPYIVKVKPGSSSENGFNFILPSKLLNSSFKDVLGHVINKDNELKESFTRKDERIIDRLKVETDSHYGLVVNRRPITGEEKIKDFFSETTIEGMTYKELVLIVAARQEGGK